MKLGRVLFVGAHTDDIELFAGGLFARKRLRDGKDSLATLTFSSHRGVTDHQAAEREHYRNMVGNVAVVELHNLSACNGDFSDKRATLYRRIAEAVDKFKPDVVVTHAGHDTNQDHRQVYDEVMRACKALNVSILTGEYPFNHLNGPLPTFFVELTEEEVDYKVQMINEYQSQKAEHRLYFDKEVWFGLAKVRGASVGLPYAEAFHVERIKV